MAQLIECSRGRAAVASTAPGSQPAAHPSCSQERVATGVFAQPLTYPVSASDTRRLHEYEHPNPASIRSRPGGAAQLSAHPRYQLIG